MYEKERRIELQRHNPGAVRMSAYASAGFPSESAPLFGEDSKRVCPMWRGPRVYSIIYNSNVTIIFNCFLVTRRLGPA